MRFVRYAVLAAACALAFHSTPHGQALDAAQVLAAAREALGGEKNLTSVKTFTATGRTRQIRGNNLVPIEFEISCELPDRFARRDEIPAQDTVPTLTGFNRDDLILFPPPPPAPGRAGGPPATPAGRAGESPPPNAGRGGGTPSAEGRGRGGPPFTPAQQRLVTIKQDFARLMLGMFAASFPSYPLTFKYAAQGEAPEGKADLLDVAGPDNFAARLVVQRETHLPVMLMWQVPATNQAKPVEYRMYYGDFRDVNGLKWPFRIRRAVAGETTEETTFDRIRINQKIDPRKFEVPK
jgi:hypothetical protein